MFAFDKFETECSIATQEGLSICHGFLFSLVVRLGRVVPCVVIDLKLTQWAFLWVSGMVSKYEISQFCEHPFRKQWIQRLDVGLGARIAVVADSHSHLIRTQYQSSQMLSPSYILHARGHRRF